MNQTISPDWKALEFKCVHEADRLPRLDPEADAWYREAVTLNRDGLKYNDEARLKRSFELSLKAAQQGHVKAMNNVVLGYLEGEGVAQNDKLAVDWAERLIAKDVGMGYYHMGTFLQRGVGVKPDKAASFAYFRRAADLGNAQGQLVVGKEITYAFVGHPDKPRADEIGRAMMQCALHQGLAEAGYALGIDYKGVKDGSRAAAAHQAAGKLGYRLSLSALAELFEGGGFGIEPDQARASCYRRLAKELREDKTKKFPNLDQICPLPPRKMPGS